MSRAKATPAPTAPTIDVRCVTFCDYAGRALLQVRDGAPAEHVRDQAYMLVASVAEIIGTAVASGDEDTLSTSTLAVIAFAADAAAAMVQSLEVKA